MLTISSPFLLQVYELAFLVELKIKIIGMKKPFYNIVLTPFLKQTNIQIKRRQIN